MQGAVCLAKFKHYPDVHDKQRYDLGVLMGQCGVGSVGQCRAQSCQSMEIPRYMFITWNCIMQLPIILISEIHVHKLCV